MGRKFIKKQRHKEKVKHKKELKERRQKQKIKDTIDYAINTVDTLNLK